MKVLVIGSGGREHAICWRLRRSSKIEELYCAPGNPGIASQAKLVPFKVDQIEKLADFAVQQSIDLTIVGPEYPLSLGIVDVFCERGLKIFGPTKAASQLEASKSFAKEIMNAADVPTAAYHVFDSEATLRAHLAKSSFPLVLKADGLAAGKGVFVCLQPQDAEEALPQLYGSVKATRVVVEDFLTGHEVSYIVATDGTQVVPMAASHDYKRLGDNNQGPNTGGMGAVCPTPYLSQDQEMIVIDRVIKPVLHEMKRRGTPFVGFLYAGLMISERGEVFVLEFNARLGDPETQAIMRRFEGDFAVLLLSLCEGRQVATATFTWSKNVAVGVVLASDGYPGQLRLGDEISGLEHVEMVPEAVAFHAGTALNEKGMVVTAGGRVLNVTAQGSDLEEARARVYKACDMIQFRGRQCRRDIGR